MIDARAEKNLTGVHPDLVRVVRECAETCPISFTITEGLRTKERQAKLVAEGASKTMNSRHLTGHAVDLAALLDMDGDGKLEIRWDFGLYVRIAQTMGRTANLLELPIIWGGCWQQIDGSENLDFAVNQYTARMKKAGKRALIDGPHFELPRGAYPG